MIQIKNVSIVHKKDMRELISDLSFVLNDGDKAVFIGEEGNGKSTLLKLIYDEALVADYVEYSGEIIRNNCILGYLPQELEQEEKEKSVYDFLSEEEGFWACEPKELAMYAGKLNIPVSLLYSEQYMDTLSGGEKIKIYILRILCKKPDVLLLDEPSNDIDLNTLDWLEKFILEWDKALLFVSHDEILLERTANKIIHLEQIKKKKEVRNTVKNVDYETYVKERAAGLKKQEQMAKKERSEYKTQQERFRQISQKVEHQQKTITRADPHGAKMLKKKMHTLKSMEKRFEKQYGQMTENPDAEESIFIKFKEVEPLPAGKTVLDISLPSLMIKDRVLAKNIHIEVAGAKKVCIIGNNGVGKTTLIKCIAEKLLERKGV